MQKMYYFCKRKSKRKDTYENEIIVYIISRCYAMFV